MSDQTISRDAESVRDALDTLTLQHGEDAPEAYAALERLDASAKVLRSLAHVFEREVGPLTIRRLDGSFVTIVVRT